MKMSKNKQNIKPLTGAEQQYFRLLNNEAGIAMQQMQLAQQRLVACAAFLREQHNAPEGKWALNDIQIGFVLVESKE